MSSNFFLIVSFMWKNVVEPNRPQITIRRMLITCWIPKATNTHSYYVIFIAFPMVTMVARPHLNVILYVHCLFCFVSRRILITFHVITFNDDAFYFIFTEYCRLVLSRTMR
jgi:hypothetical protein